MRTLHECSTANDGWQVLADCEGATTLGAGPTIGIIGGGLLLLGVIGYLVWRRVQMNRILDE